MPKIFEYFGFIFYFTPTNTNPYMFNPHSNMTYNKSLLFIIVLLLSCRMSAQQLCGSDIVKVPFSVTDTGKPTPIKWGMDTAWDDEGNVLRGINFIGADRLTYGRVSFQVMDPVNADGTLSARQQKFLRSRLQHIALSKPTGILLNSAPVDINVDIFTTTPNSGTRSSRQP